MCTIDERIIEYLAEESWATAGVLEREIRLNASKARIYERLKLLAQVGLVAPIYEGSNMYEITGQGREYLQGDLDMKHRPTPKGRAT